MIGYMLDLGAFFMRPAIGVLFDASGPNRSFAGAALLGGVGYLIISRGVAGGKGSATNSVGFLSVGFILVGIAGSLAYTAALFTITSNFPPKGRAMAVSFASGGMGLSALLVALVYRFGFSTSTGSSSLSGFFLVFSIAMFVVFGQAAIFANVPNFRPKGGIDLPTALRSCKNMLANADFWSMAGPFGLTIGIGLVATNNAASIVGAVLGPEASLTEVERFTFVLVAIYSIVGTAIRLIVGRCMNRYPTIPAAYYLMLSCLLSALGFFVFVLHQTRSSLYVLYALVGLGMGAPWTPCITLLKMFVPVETFGQSFGLLCCFAAIIGSIMNAAAAKIYDQHAVEDNRARECYGAACFQTFLWIGCALLCVGAIWSLRMLGMKRKDAVALHKALLNTSTASQSGSLSSTDAYASASAESK